MLRKLPFIFFVTFLTFLTCLTFLTSSSFPQEPSKEEETLFVAKKAFEDGFYEVSLGLLERFLKNYPNSSKTHEVNLLVGQCYFQQNRFLEAVKKFEAILNNPLAKSVQDACLYWIAEVHFKENNFKQATNYYERIIDEFPKSSYLVAAYYSLGWCLFQENKFSEALKYFQIVEEQFPREPQARDVSFKIIECMFNLKDYAGLKDKLNSYLKVYAQDKSRLAYLYFYQAESDYYRENFQEAIEEYDKVILNTLDAKIQALSKLGAGWSYLKLKEYAKAGELFSGIKSEDLEKKSNDVLSLGKAVLLFEGRNFSEAKNIYQELIKVASDATVLAQGYLGKADALYNLNEYNEAIKVYQEALVKIREAVPQEIIDKLHYGLAWSFLKQGEFKKAIDEFQKIVIYSEDNTIKVACLCQIGDAYQESGDYNKATLTYNNILKDYPNNPYADYVQYQLGLSLLKSSQYDSAVLVFRRLKGSFPNSQLLDDVSYSLALAYFQKGDYSLSKEFFKKFQQEFKDSNLVPQAVYFQGASLYNLGKFNEAIEVFKNIVRNYNQDRELVQKAEYEIADAYYQIGDEFEAISRFRTLRSKYPDSKFTPEIIWWLGQYYYRHNELTLARRYLSSLIQDFPQSDLVALAYYILGLTYEEESKYQEAIDNLKRTAELNKTDLGAQAALATADIYAKQERIDLALATYKEVIQKNIQLADVVYPRVADLYRQINNYDEAINFYRRSLEAVPASKKSYIQFQIAEVLQAQGKILEAITEYLKVANLYPEDKDLVAKSLLRIATIYEDKENFQEAVNVYKRIASMRIEEAKYAQERIDWISAYIK